MLFNVNTLLLLLTLCFFCLVLFLVHVFITYLLNCLFFCYIAEIGDFDANKHNYGYVSEFRIMASQTKDFELRVADIHKQLKGIGPAQTEFNYLDKVKWLDMYGVDLHPVLVSLHSLLI